MAKITVSKLVRAPKEKVVEYFATPHLYFKVHEKYYKWFEILKEENNVAYVDEVWEIGGRLSRFTHKIVVNLPHNIEMEIIAGDGKGSKEVISFEEEGNQTKVTYHSDFKLGGITGVLIGWLVSSQMKKMMEEMADEDRRFIEGNGHFGESVV